MIAINGMKLCSACGKLKPVSEFHTNNAGDGYYSICKLCKKARIHSASGRQYSQACDTCFYLRKCRARIKDMWFEPYCFICSPHHRHYVRRYGRQEVGA